MRKRITPLALVLIAGACAEQAATGSDAASELATWTVDPQPLLEIGVLEGPPEYQFARAQPALRLSDGRVLVSEGSAQELRMFDAAGRHVRTIGGNGEGPGEFRSISFVFLFAGDSILAQDYDLGRVSIFAPSGDFVRSFLLDAVPGFAPTILGVFDDGSMLVRPYAEGEFLQIPDGVVRDTLGISLVDRDGELVRQIARLPGDERFGAGAMISPRPFGAEGLVATGRDAFYYASTDAFRIERRAPDGTVLGVIEKQVAPEPVTVAHQERWRQERLESATARSREMVEQLVEAMTFPEMMPALHTLAVDRAGNLWVQTRAIPDAADPWTVFDADGREIAEIELPDGFNVQDIGDDWILGTVRDEVTDVPVVRLLQLIKAGE